MPSGRFFVASVPGAGINEDGEGLMAQLDDGAGNTLELVVHYTQLPEIIAALQEAGNKAFDRRRALAKVDQAVSQGDLVSERVTGFAYSVAEDRSRLLLKLATENGRRDIEFEAAVVPGFAEATARNATLLAQPPRKQGH